MDPGTRSAAASATPPAPEHDDDGSGTGDESTEGAVEDPHESVVCKSIDHDDAFGDERYHGGRTSSYGFGFDFEDDDSILLIYISLNIKPQQSDLCSCSLMATRWSSLFLILCHVEIPVCSVRRSHFPAHNATRLREIKDSFINEF